MTAFKALVTGERMPTAKEGLVAAFSMAETRFVAFSVNKPLLSVVWRSKYPNAMVDLHANNVSRCALFSTPLCTIPI